MQKPACVVVLFNPDPQGFVNNLETYINCVEKIYIIDNSTNKNDFIVQSLELNYSGRFNYCPNYQNLGIAKALNQGCYMAFEEGSQWCLLMDQDSSFSPHDKMSFFGYFSDAVAHRDDIAIFNIPYEVQKVNLPISTCLYSITSGSIIRLNVFKKIGGHDEMLFIDEVDMDYSYRAILSGYEILQYNKAKLIHNMGLMKKSGYFGFLFVKNRRIHNQSRLYYMVRNYLIVRKRYRKYFIEDFKARDMRFLVAIKNNLLFSDSIVKSFYYAIKGLFHFYAYRY